MLENISYMYEFVLWLFIKSVWWKRSMEFYTHCLASGYFLLKGWNKKKKQQHMNSVSEVFWKHKTDSDFHESTSSAFFDEPVYPIILEWLDS